VSADTAHGAVAPTARATLFSTPEQSDKEPRTQGNKREKQEEKNRRKSSHTGGKKAWYRRTMPQSEGGAIFNTQHQLRANGAPAVKEPLLFARYVRSSAPEEGGGW